MSSLLIRIRNFIEKIIGFDIERIGKWSIAMVAQNYRKDAWSLQRCQLRSLIEEFGIDVVIDVGANEGQFARKLREFYCEDIHSFEPVSSAFEKLSKAAEDDPKWHVYNFALGSERSTQSINVSNLTVFSSLRTANRYCSSCFGDEPSIVKKEEIEVFRLDALLESLVPDIDTRKLFMKMDTQGYDIEVFKGLGDKSKYLRAFQSEISIVPIYEKIPHWTESILTYEKSNFKVAGMFPVNRDSWNVIEYDCLLVAKDI